MCNFPRGMAESDPGVESGRSQPLPPGPSIVVQFVGTPQADVMPAARIVADGLLKGQVLFAVEEIQAADRGVRVRTPQHRRFGDAERALKSDRIGRKPVRSEQRPMKIILQPPTGPH